jgi:hypothetical protein
MVVEFGGENLGEELQQCLQGQVERLAVQERTLLSHCVHYHYGSEAGRDRPENRGD